MDWKSLNVKSNLRNEPKLSKKLKSLEGLLEDLKEREIKLETISEINGFVEEINNTSEVKALKKIVRKNYHKIVTLLVKKEKLTPKGYYRNIWTALGMTVFGIPLGLALSSSLENMAFIGLGLPMGLAIGVGAGTAMDESAAKKGTQLKTDYEV